MSRWRSKHPVLQNYVAFPYQLQKVAINDVLPHKAARRDAIDNLKFWGLRDTSDLISVVPFIFTVRRHLIPLSS